MHTLEHIVKKVVPYISGRSKVHFWDAGCAMGQEAYSLSIIFAENLGHFAFKNLCIHATDIDESDLFEKIIKDGLYPEKELKRIPEEYLKKYFKKSKNEEYFKIVEKIQNSISFQKHNLLSLNTIGEGFSLILCKNVLLHFQQEERINVIKMFHKSLAPGGYLATEQTQKLPDKVKHLFKKVIEDGQLFEKI